MLLHKKGINSIYFAEDGEKGVETVQKNGMDFFDLIFMDNTMPHMVSTTRRILRELRVVTLVECGIWQAYPISLYAES